MDGRRKTPMGNEVTDVFSLLPVTGVPGPVRAGPTGVDPEVLPCSVRTP